MKIEIRYLNGERETITLACDKQDIAYEDVNGIANIYVRDELTHIINLTSVSSVKFEEVTDGVI